MYYRTLQTEKGYRARLAKKQREYRKYHDRSNEYSKRTIKRRKDREDLKRTL